MVTKFNFETAWKELSNDDKNAWEQKIIKAAKKEQTNFGCIFVKDPEVEWDKKHITAMRKSCVAKYKPLLKSATNLEEYNRVFKECAIEMEIIGF